MEAYVCDFFEGFYCIHVSSVSVGDHGPTSIGLRERHDVLGFGREVARLPVAPQLAARERADQVQEGCEVDARFVDALPDESKRATFCVTPTCQERTGGGTCIR